MNPYQASEARIPETMYGHTPTDNRTIIQSWERLRLPYNLLLFALTALLVPEALSNGHPLRPTLYYAATMALSANGCYFFGPLFEFYACSFRELRDFSGRRGIPYAIGIAITLLFYGWCYLSLSML